NPRTDRLRGAGARMYMHPDAWSGIDFDDSRTARRRRADVGGNEVHPADVEADHPRGPLANVADARMYQRSDIRRGATGREVGVLAQRHLASLFRNGRRMEPLLLQVGQ